MLAREYNGATIESKGGAVANTVLYHREETMGYITLNRPEVLNAINEEWLGDLAAAVAEAREDAGARTIVVKGEGRAFCAGADLRDGTRQYDSLTEYRQRRTDPMQDIGRALRRLGKPVIGQIHGYAVGGGCELALMCDLRLAAEGTRFGFTEVRVGATITLGGIYNLARVVGMGRAFEMLYTTDLIDAQEAWRTGLVNRVASPGDLDVAVADLARRIGSYYPLELALTRNSVYRAMDSDFDTALEEEAQASLISYASGSRMTGMKDALDRIRSDQGESGR